MTILRTNKSFIIILLAALFIFIFQDLFFVGNLYAQDSSKELLKSGIQYYKNAEFDSAIKTLEKTAQLKLETDLEVQLYKYLAFSYAATGNENQAKLNYLKLLEIDPLFNLSLSESPRLRKPFQMAQKEYSLKDKDSPVIHVKVPEFVTEKTKIKVLARITDASGIASAHFYYKNPVENKFIRLLMKETTKDSFSSYNTG